MASNLRECDAKIYQFDEKLRNQDKKHEVLLNVMKVYDLQMQ